MRRAGALLTLALGCAGPFPVAPDRIQLPRTELRSPDLPSALTRIDLTAEGRLWIDGAPHTLAQTGAAVRGPVLVRADASASLLHLDLLLGELRRAGVEEISLAAAGPGGPVAVRVAADPLDECTIRSYEEWIAVHARVVGFSVEPEPARGTPGVVRVRECRPSSDAPWSAEVREELVRFDGAFADSVRAVVDRAHRDLHVEPVAWISSDSRLTVQGWLEMVQGLAEGGLREVLWPSARAHGWTREQDPLPLPPQPCFVGSFSDVLDDHTRRALAPVLLPFAPTVQEDKDIDPDHRVIVSVDGDGRWLHGEVTLGLEGVRRFLREQSRAYDERLRARGDTGYEVAPSGRPWSKLYVLLRADRETRWRDVRLFLALLREEGLYKLQYAATRWADLRYDAREAAAYGVPWTPVLPVPGSLEGRLQVFLRTGEPWPGEVVRHFAIERDAQGWPRFLGPDWVARDRAGLRMRMDAMGRYGRAVVHVSDDVDMQAVVSLVEAVQEHGCDHIDLDPWR